MLLNLHYLFERESFVELQRDAFRVGTHDRNTDASCCDHHVVSFPNLLCFTNHLQFLFVVSSLRVYRRIMRKDIERVLLRKYVARNWSIIKNL